MLDPEREAEMDLEGDSNEVSGSSTTRSASQFMDYEMGMMFSSLSPLDPSFDCSVSLWNSPSPARRPQSPEFEISLWNFPSPSRGPSTEPGFSRLISSHGNASSSTQPPVRSPSPPFREQGDVIFLEQILEQILEQCSRVRLELLQLLEQLRLLLEEILHLLEEVEEVLHPLEEVYLDRLRLLEQLLQLVEEVLEEVLLTTFFMVQQLARLCSLSNKKRELHEFILNVFQITLQIKIKKAHEICKEGHDNTSIEILDKMTVATDVFKLHFSWTKAPCRHRSQNNASDLKKSCTSFDGCYKHQDCMSTVKLEICIDFYVDDMEILQKLFSSHMPFLCSKYTLVRYGGKIESQGVHAICEPIAPAHDEPDSRCELTHILHCTRSPPGPNGLPDGEEMSQQDSPKHQLMGETHAMNDGENVLSEDAKHGAVSYPDNEGTRKTLKRKRGKNKIQIPPEDLLTFSGTVRDAVKHLKVSKSTIKRRCREHGITNWQSRKIDNNSQSHSKPKDIIESTRGEGAEMGNQMAGGSESRGRELNHEQFGFPPESEKSLDMSQCIQASGELLKDHNISAIVAFNTEQVPESSRTNLSCSIPVAKLPEATAAHMMPLVTEMQDTRTVTIKATYEEDMIRFQLSLTSGITELRREVAERLKLEVDSFSIKYLDDDDDLILMTGDKDLHECFKISVSLGRKFIKLSIHKGKGN